ncbi:unnamed protein product [Nippostrongylus brasiliensis]|uniref:Zinc finger protein n=1 Tax=Nippostrongylus brasiliensis TaxID=27835 RepID=A0A0N4XD46_NIPBR|nr:unnamed protein product [Nippostrongylus brasiliensis]
MMEDSYEEIINQLEEELKKEEEEAKTKADAAEELIKEMEKSAKDFKETRKMVQKWKNLRDVREQRVAENQRKVTLFCCFVCSKMFIDEEGMRQHISDKHLALKKEYRYKCTKCFRRFTKPHHLRRHLETHTKTGMSCSVCRKEFREALSVEIHMSKAHNLSIDGVVLEKKHQCTKCGKRFGIVEEVKRHSYYCGSSAEIAERRRKAREELDAMSAITSQSSPARSIASSASDIASTVSIGSDSGRPVKDKSCPFCFLVCASMQSRRRHIERKHPDMLAHPEVDQHSYVKVQSPVLPYVCDLCNKTFASHASLSTHKRRIHENRNDHECPVCFKRYPLASEMRKHVQRVHEKSTLSSSSSEAVA